MWPSGVLCTRPEIVELYNYITFSAVEESNIRDDFDWLQKSGGDMTGIRNSVVSNAILALSMVGLYAFAVCLTSTLRVYKPHRLAKVS